MAGKREIAEERRSQMIASWYRNGPERAKNDEEREQAKKTYEEQIQSIQQAAQEVYEMDQEIETCDINNIIHSAKITRTAEAHNAKAQAYMAKVK